MFELRDFDAEKKIESILHPGLEKAAELIGGKPARYLYETCDLEVVDVFIPELVKILRSTEYINLQPPEVYKDEYDDLETLYRIAAVSTYFCYSSISTFRGVLKAEKYKVQSILNRDLFGDFHFPYVLSYVMHRTGNPHRNENYPTTMNFRDFVRIIADFERFRDAAKFMYSEEFKNKYFNEDYSEDAKIKFEERGDSGNYIYWAVRAYIGPRSVSPTRAELVYFVYTVMGDVNRLDREIFPLNWRHLNLVYQCFRENPKITGNATDVKKFLKKVFSFYGFFPRKWKGVNWDIQSLEAEMGLNEIGRISKFCGILEEVALEYQRKK